MFGKKQIFIDTETSGISPSKGHKIIEFAAIEVIDRKITGSFLHFYFNVDIKIEKGAYKIHGIDNNFLKDKPIFSDKAKEIIEYIKGHELIMHNAPFDVSFINKELSLISNNNFCSIEKYCSIFDTLKFARKKHPGQKNSLDSLCDRYKINRKNRVLHGALLDASILAEVFLSMTGGQKTLFSLSSENYRYGNKEKQNVHFNNKRTHNLIDKLLISEKNEEHEKYLDILKNKNSKLYYW